MLITILLASCDALTVEHVHELPGLTFLLLPLEVRLHLHDHVVARMNGMADPFDGRSSMTTKKKEDAAIFVPQERTLPVLRTAVQVCRGCDLYRRATQAVFGELVTGLSATKPKVSIMLIGEQPGDSEDKEGRPFVGPAGRLLDKCLQEAGIDRRHVYVTNTVKHFKWEPRGKLRIHKKPNMKEIHACRPWLEAELETVKPKLIVCLGAVASQSLLGSSLKVTKVHGEVQEIEGFPPIIATLHPSAILRARTDEDRHRQRHTLVGDLSRAAEFVSE
jgi:DNA polymerase